MRQDSGVCMSFVELIESMAWILVLLVSVVIAEPTDGKSVYHLAISGILICVVKSIHPKQMSSFICQVKTFWICICFASNIWIGIFE